MLSHKVLVIGELASEIADSLHLSGFAVSNDMNSENINAAGVLVLVKEAIESNERQIVRFRRLGFVGKILLVTKTDISDKTKSDFYDAGVDGFEIQLGLLVRLPARIRSILRVYSNKDTGILIAGNLIYGVEGCRTAINNQEVHLGPTERSLLVVLLLKEGKVYTREELIEKAWGNNIHVDSRTVDVHIGRLRKILIAAGVDGFSIDTVRGAGYRGSW